MQKAAALLAACAMLAIVPAGTALAQSSNNPIPGIDVVVKKKPAGSAITVGACQSGGGKIVREGGAWVCTGMPAGKATKR